jgi:hypothetical protein
MGQAAIPVGEVVILAVLLSGPATNKKSKTHTKKPRMSVRHTQRMSVSAEQRMDIMSVSAEQRMDIMSVSAEQRMDIMSVSAEQRMDIITACY